MYIQRGKDPERLHIVSGNNEFLAQRNSDNISVIKSRLSKKPASKVLRLEEYNYLFSLDKAMSLFLKLELHPKLYESLLNNFLLEV